jgi:hypothetical protein
LSASCLVVVIAFKLITGHTLLGVKTFFLN